MNVSKKAIGIGILYIVVKWTIIILVGGAVYRAGLWRNEYLFAIPVILLCVGGVYLWRKRRVKDADRQSETLKP